MAPINKPQLKPKPKLLLPRRLVPGNNPVSASQPGPSPNPNVASGIVPQPQAASSPNAVLVTASQPGPSRNILSAVSQAGAGPSRIAVPGPLSQSQPRPGPSRISSTPGLPRSMIPIPGPVNRRGIGRPYASASPSPHRLPVFPAVPVNANGVAAAGPEAEAEPISPIEPVRPGIEDDTIPLNSTAFDDSILDATESVEQDQGTSKRIRRIRKQNSPQKGSKNTNKVINEIRKYQHGAELLIPKSSFRRLVRGSTGVTRYRFTKEAYEALQEASEDYMVKTFMKAQACAFHAKRITVQPVDMLLAERLDDF